MLHFIGQRGYVSAAAQYFICDDFILLETDSDLHVLYCWYTVIIVWLFCEDFALSTHGEAISVSARRLMLDDWHVPGAFHDSTFAPTPNGRVRTCNHVCKPSPSHTHEHGPGYWRHREYNKRTMTKWILLLNLDLCNDAVFTQYLRTPSVKGTNGGWRWVTSVKTRLFQAEYPNPRAS